MSYLVLARKWRPLNFDDVVGQEHITQTLRKAIEKDRVAHAYLFTGTRGVGKTTTARIFARALNCEKGPTPDPCGVCESCKGIISGSNMDVMEIDGASNNSVDDIRELRDNVGYASMGGRYRIYVIDEVHMLSKSAFNALLKTLEEPPPKVIFVFATTESNKIPATIHSRCQRYDFRRITSEQIAGQLRKICDAEKVRYEQQGLLLVARKADGSMRDALSLLDQVFSYGQEEVTEAGVRKVLGVVDVESYRTIMDAAIARNPGPVLDIVDSVLRHGYDLSDFIIGLQDYIRNLLFARVPGLLESRSHELSAEAATAFVKQATAFSETTLLRMGEVVRRAETELRWSSYPRFLVESMLLKLIHMDETVSLEKLLKTIDPASGGGVEGETTRGGARSVPVSSPAAVPHAQVSATVAMPEKKNSIDPPWLTTSTQQAAIPPATVHEPVESTTSVSTNGDDAEPEIQPGTDDSFLADSGRTSSRDLNRDWDVFLKLLIEDRPNLGAFLSQAIVVSAGSSSVDLRYPSIGKFQYGEVSKKSNHELIEKKLALFAGSHVELHITLETGAEGGSDGSGLSGVSSLEDEIRQDPMIEKVLEFFDGELLT